MNIDSRGDSDELWVFIDGYVHLFFHKKHFRGLQSYREIKYTIEVVLKDQTIKLEYDSKDLWLKVLFAIQQYL